MKRIPAKSLVIVLLTAGLTILSGCFNLLDPPQEGESERGSLTIHIGGTPEVARTLYPNATFTRYELSFTPLEGQATYAPKSITGASVVIDDIAHGLWEITAKGYVTIGGNEYEAAFAPAQTVDISGSPQSISFTLSARNESSGAPGVFSYAVSFPPAKVEWASLSLFDPETQDWVQDSKGNRLNETDLAAASAGQISLNPGYYLMRIELRNQYQGVVRTEIVHIYSNMETTANYTFTEADFTDFITLSGTVNVTINGAAANDASLYLYDNPECSGQNIGYSWVDPDTGAWSMSFDSPASTTTYYIEVYAGDGVRSYRRPNAVDPITVDPASTPGPLSLGTIDFSSITLSGTVNITVNGTAPEYVWVTAYTVSNDWLANVQADPSTGAWTMRIEPFDTPTEVYFTASAQTAGGGYFSYEPEPRITVSGSDISGIDLGTKNFAVITLSGTVNLTVNGTASQDVRVNAYTVSNDWQMQVGYVGADPSTGAWTMSIEPFDTPTEVYFTVDAYAAERWFYYEPGITRTVSGSDISGIDLGTKNFAVITLSGTVSVIINGAAPNNATLSLYDTPECNDQYIGYASINRNTGAWSTSFESPASTTTYYIKVEASDNEGGYWRSHVAGSITVDPASPPGPLSLGTIDFDATYTVTAASGLSGGSISVNPPSGTAGTTITVTPSPASGYLLKAGTLKYNYGTTDHVISGTSFTLPAANVTVSAEFVAITYNVTAASGLSGGSISVNPPSGTAGTTITVTPSPAPGYRLKAGTLTYNDGTDHAISGTTFTLPAANVRVSAEFETVPSGTYTVTAATVTGGSISVNPPSGTAGTTITVTPSPAPGYRLKTGTLTYNDGTDHAISGTTFTLPAAHVTVSAEFEVTGTVLGISFAGFGDEEIGLWPDTAITLSKSNYDNVMVSVTGDWDSVRWYGAVWSENTQIELYAPSYLVGKHTATATVKKGSVFYSKTLHFEVVR